MRLHPRNTTIRLLSAAALLGGLGMAVPGVAQESNGAVQTSAVRGVTVKVTPGSLAAEAVVWTFAVVLDTHSEDLGDDLMNIAVLVADDGRQFKPRSWTGAPAGGHHREGTLEFAAIKPAPKAVELKMHRPGEAEPRSFRWTVPQ
ncbi:MAG TPA: hypothetical protein VLI46_06210 [Ramlibacter sp.]|nr:hypothetical protein [Ramlibacter sp.]